MLPWITSRFLKESDSLVTAAWSHGNCPLCTFDGWMWGQRTKASKVRLSTRKDKHESDVEAQTLQGDGVGSSSLSSC